MLCRLRAKVPLPELGRTHPHGAVAGHVLVLPLMPSCLTLPGYSPSQCSSHLLHKPFLIIPMYSFMYINI